MSDDHNTFNEVLVKMESYTDSNSDDDQSQDYSDDFSPFAKKKKRVNSYRDTTMNSKKKVKPTTAEKKALAALIENERMLWDMQDEQYTQNRTEAWERISEKMPDRTSMYLVFHCEIHRK